jgi:hypothetical protein
MLSENMYPRIRGTRTLALALENYIKLFRKQE